MTHFLYKRKSFSGHLDSGADIFAITSRPSRWPKMETITQLNGIGQPQNLRKTSNEIYWRDGKDCEGTFWQYNVSHLPVNFRNLEIMTHMGVYLYYSNTVIANQIFQQGLFQIMGLREWETVWSYHTYQKSSLTIFWYFQEKSLKSLHFMQTQFLEKWRDNIGKSVVYNGRKKNISFPTGSSGITVTHYTLNPPVSDVSSGFVIKMKLGNWRLIQDLRQVNETMQSICVLQPWLTSTAKPKDIFKII